MTFELCCLAAIFVRFSFLLLYLVSLFLEVKVIQAVTVFDDTLT